MNETPQTNAEFARLMQLGAEAWRDEVIGADPDGDWHPVLAVQAPSGQIAVPEIPTDLFQFDAGKDALAQAIGNLCANAVVQRAALLISGWTLDIKANADGSAVDVADRPVPSESPDRVERLILHVADNDADETWHAQIIRFADEPPLLGEWERMEGYSVAGRFPEALRRVRECV